MKKIIFALMLLSAVRPGIAAEDVAGVKIGVDFASQRHLVNKANADYEIVEIRNSKGASSGVKATTRNDVFVVLHNSDGIVWYVGRAQSFEKGGRPEVDVLRSSLKEKYGKPSREDGWAMVWAYNRAGDQLAASDAAVCRTVGSSQSIGNKHGDFVNVPSRFSASCGHEISAYINDDTDGMLRSFKVEIANHKIMYDQLQAEEDQRVQERSRRLQEEKSRAVKPQL